MTYTFNRDKVLKLIKATQEAKHHLVRYTNADEPGLDLVGDEGVYLMSNRADKDNIGEENCAYANECNPHTLEFDVWWTNKREGFGADDGVNFIPLEDVQKWIQGEGELCIEITLEHLSLITRQSK